MSEHETIRTIESYESEIKELKLTINRLTSDLKNANAEINAGNREIADKKNQINHLSGMVDALKFVIRDAMKVGTQRGSEDCYE